MTESSPEDYRASFNPLIRPYLVVYIGFVMMATLILFPLAIVWFCGVGQWWARHYFDRLQCVMNRTSLRFRKGIIFQVEKTVPLENIQDVTFIEGPLLKHFHLSILRFETAGQSAGQAHNMQLVGVINADQLRTEILTRREQLKASYLASAPNRTGSSEQAYSGDPKSLEVLQAILARLDEITAHLKSRS